MKTKLFALLLLTGTSMFAAHFSIGVNLGYPGYYAPAPVAVYAPPPPPVVSYYRPACPGPGYSWVGGYWYPSGPRYAWRAGYWARPAYARSYWVGPRYSRSRYYGGYWRR
jgi:hypothetical protein